MGSFGNSFKTVLLLALLTAIVLWIGNFFGGPQGLIIALFFVMIFNGISFWWSDRLVLKMYRTQELPSNHHVTKIVRHLASMAGLPMPKVHLAPTQTPNAFATGRSPKHAAVVVTQGILDLLSERELKGVIAHELAHIQNRDTLISTVAGILAGLISYAAMMARWGAIFGLGRDGDSNLLELLVLAIVTPIVAFIIQMAISRTREYAADATGAKIVQDSQGLKHALLKLHKGTQAKPLKYNEASAATAHLFIMNPFKAGSFFEWMSTHPPVEKRVAKLDAMDV